MKVNVVELSPCEKRAEVTVSLDEVKTTYAKCLGDIRREAVIPGFRSGKAPVSVVEGRFKELIQKETIRSLIGDSFDEALKAVDATPVSQPDIDWDEFNKGEVFEYHITYEVIPDITVEGLDEIYLEPELTIAQVTDEDVDARIEELREGSGIFAPVDRANPREGDRIVIDYETTFIDQDPVKSEGVEVVLLKDRVQPQIYEAALSMSVGETKQVAYTLSDSHDEEDSSVGAEVKTEFTLVTIKEKVLPQLDDEFAKDNDYESLAHMKEKIRADITDVRTKEAEKEDREKVLEALLEKNQFPVPTRLVEAETSEVVYRTFSYMQAQGIDFQAMDMDFGEMMGEARERTVSNVKRGILLNALAKQAGIEVGDEDVEAEIQNMVEESGYAEDKIRANYEEGENRANLKEKLLADKVIDFVVAKARTQKAPTGDDVPADQGDTEKDAAVEDAAPEIAVDVADAADVEDTPVAEASAGEDAAAVEDGAGEE